MIPKIIHYCWFGGKPIPDHLQKYISDWSQKCPDWEIKLWNEESFDVDQHIFTQTADRKSTRLNSSHMSESRMPSSA